MAELVERMRAAARQARIDDDGPLTPLLEAFMLTLARLGTVADRNARISADHTTAVAATLDQARRVADAETERFRAHLDAATAETIRDVAGHIARSADAALIRRVRVVGRNSVLIAAAVLAGSILAAASAVTGGAAAVRRPPSIRPKLGCRPRSTTSQQPLATGSTS